MGIFSNKQKVDMECFCKDYYDYVFQDLIYNLYNDFYQQLADSDPSFLKFDRTLFILEMTAMHLELFALAFLRRFNNFNKAVKNSIFTLGYLQDKDRGDIWEAMGEYSIVLAKTATMNSDGQQMTGHTGVDRMKITRVNETRFELIKGWDKDNPNATDDTMRCVARVGNLIGADIEANNQTGNRFLCGSFLERLGAERIFGKNWMPSESVLPSLALQPISMYDFATHLLKNVDLQFP